MSKHLFLNLLQDNTFIKHVARADKCSTFDIFGWIADCLQIVRRQLVWLERRAGSNVWQPFNGWGKQMRCLVLHELRKTKSIRKSTVWLSFRFAWVGHLIHWTAVSGGCHCMPGQRKRFISRVRGSRVRQTLTPTLKLASIGCGKKKALEKKTSSCMDSLSEVVQLVTWRPKDLIYAESSYTVPSYLGFECCMKWSAPTGLMSSRWGCSTLPFYCSVH